MRLFIIISFISVSFTGFSQHTIVLKSGKKIQGVVMGLQDDIWSIAINRELKEIPMVQVSSMFFDEYVPYDGSMVVDKTNEKAIKSGDGNYMIKYNIVEREMITAPRVSNGSKEKGTVVVEIVVNQNGNVIAAKPGGSGSTTSSEYLYTKAKFAAQGAKFNADRIGPARTEGYIEITY